MIIKKREIQVCCWFFILYTHTPRYRSSDENGIESAARKTLEDITWKMVVCLPLRLLGSLRLTLGRGIPFIPLFLGWWVSESSVLCLAKLDLWHQIFQVFTSYDKVIFLTLFTKILTSQQWEETCMRTGHPSTSYW